MPGYRPQRSRFLGSGSFKTSPGDCDCDVQLRWRTGAPKTFLPLSLLIPTIPISLQVKISQAAWRFISCCWCQWMDAYFLDNAMQFEDSLWILKITFRNFFWNFAKTFTSFFFFFNCKVQNETQTSNMALNSPEHQHKGLLCSSEWKVLL